MSGSVWPPAPSEDDELVEVTIHLADGARGRPRSVKVTGRRVLLWGQPVVINPDGDVHCDFCWSWIRVAELGSPTNTHGVGLRAPAGALFPWVES